MTDPRHAPRRWIIDFGHRTLEDAERFPEALAIVRQRVKPQRDKVRRETYRHNWWRFSEPISELRRALADLSRYIACPAQGKRILFSWVDVAVCPSNLITVFAFQDDYAHGILSSFAHPTSDAQGRQGQALALQQLAATRNVKAVVVMIGANNYGFAAIVQRCVTNFLTSPRGGRTTARTTAT